MVRAATRPLVLILFSTTFALLLGEGLLRLFTPETFLQGEHPPWGFLVSDPVMGWGLKPGYESPELSVNRMGLRGPERPMRKPAGVLRIACLGDSSTFGITRTGEKTFDMSSYPQLLEELANAEGGRRVEVINGGVMGYTSFHGLRQLLTRILPLRPDIVTVRFGMNDHGWQRPGMLQAKEPESAWQRWLLYSFHDWRLARLLLSVRAKGAHDAEASEVARGASPEEFERNLERFVEESRSHGFHLAFIDYPIRSLEQGLSPRETQEEFPRVLFGADDLTGLHELHDRYQQILYRVARDNDIPLIETREALQSMDPPGFGDWDLVHPSEGGKRRTAEIILSRLRELDWLR